jgi:hypothetical protein
MMPSFHSGDKKSLLADPFKQLLPLKGITIPQYATQWMSWLSNINVVLIILIQDMMLVVCRDVFRCNLFLWKK